MGQILVARWVTVPEWKVRAGLQDLIVDGLEVSGAIIKNVVKTTFCKLTIKYVLF